MLYAPTEDAAAAGTDMIKQAINSIEFRYLECGSISSIIASTPIEIPNYYPNW